MAKTYEQLVRRIVEGQARSFINDHPEILDTGTTTWKTPRNKSRAKQLEDSIAKRIILDLTSPATRKMLVDALAREVALGEPVELMGA